MSAAYKIPVPTITSHNLVRAFSNLGYPTKHKIAARIGVTCPKFCRRLLS